MKNRIPFYIVVGLIILAVIGVASKLFTNPAGFFQGIAVMLVVGAIIFFLVRRLSTPSPAKREQRAFVKAAKRSAKRLNQKEPSQPKKKQSNLTSLKKIRTKKNHSNPQLTVIEGKKGKKKNRASFF